MAQAAKHIDDERNEAATDLVVMGNVDALEIFTDQEQFDAFYERVKAETEGVKADVSTEAGRAEIRAMAYKVVRAKASLDKAALRLTEGWRQQTANVNAARKVMVEQMAALAEQVRAPLTAWENAEKERVAAVQAKIDDMKAAAVIAEDDTSETVRQRGAIVWNVEITDAEFRDLADDARRVKAEAVATLQRARERLAKEEADRAELERLRAAEAERQEREAREREERERQERERAEAEEAERRRKEAEEAEARRVEEARQRAAEEERQRLQREQEEREAEQRRQHEAQLAEERRQREEAEAEARRERERREAEEAERQRQAEEERRREADRAHRQSVQSAAKQAIMTCGADEETAKKIVLAIVAGEIPAVSLRF